MKSFFMRLLRGTVAVTFAGLFVYLENDPRYIFIAPVVNAAAKYLRVKYGFKYLPV